MMNDSASYMKSKQQILNFGGTVTTIEGERKETVLPPGFPIFSDI